MLDSIDDVILNRIKQTITITKIVSFLISKEQITRKNYIFSWFARMFPLIPLSTFFNGISW